MTRNEYLMTVVAEECAEVAQRVSKALRFGTDEVQPGQPFTNAERVMHELADLRAAVLMAVASGALAPLSAADEDARVGAKIAKVETYLRFSAGRGLVEDAPAAQRAPVPHPEAAGACAACGFPNKPDGTCSRSQCCNSD